jgi:hypothetical protein
MSSVRNKRTKQVSKGTGRNVSKKTLKSVRIANKNPIRRVLNQMEAHKERKNTSLGKDETKNMAPYIMDKKG